MIIKYILDDKDITKIIAEHYNVSEENVGLKVNKSISKNGDMEVKFSIEILAKQQ